MRRTNWAAYWRNRRSLLFFSDHAWKEECPFLGKLQFFAPLDESRILKDMHPETKFHNYPLYSGAKSYIFLDIRKRDLLDVLVKVTYKVKRKKRKPQEITPDKLQFHVTSRRTGKTTVLSEKKFWGRHLEWWLYHDLQLSSSNVEGYIDLDQALQIKTYSFPRSGGVYLFLDPDKKPIYVGKAKHLGKRFAEHFSNLKWNGRLKMEDEEFHYKYLCYIRARDLFTQSGLEFFLIKHLKPPLNTARVSQTQIVLPDVRSEIPLTHL